MITSFAWKIRSRLSNRGRRRIRALTSRILAPLGSIEGAAPPTGMVGLTFDDGPDDFVTPQVLDLLKERRAAATFFVLTDKAIQRPDIIRRMVQEGHEIALHSDRHDRLTLIGFGELRRRLSAARAQLECLTERRVRYFRPPFGAQTLTTYLVARSCGLQVVAWRACARDWLDICAEAVATNVLSTLSDGDVILLHDGLEQPPGSPVPKFDRVHAIALVLDGIVAMQLRATTICELMTCGHLRRLAWFRP